ncbi:MAG: 1,4-alpha-glucan-branching enzyme, partial [Thermodesulfobacteriota bacterium]
MQSRNRKTSEPWQKLLELDPLLKQFEDVISRRAEKINSLEQKLTGKQMSLIDFASGHEYFGLHFRDNQWVFREWAPNAESVYLIGDFTKWREDDRFALWQTAEPG